MTIVLVTCLFYPSSFYLDKTVEQDHISLYGHYLAGNYLLKTPNIKWQAELYYKNAVMLDNIGSDYLLSEYFYAALVGGKFGDALAVIKKAKAAPEQITGNLLMALDAMKRQQFNQAIILLNQPSQIKELLHLNKTMKDFLIVLCYLGNKQVPLARKLLNKTELALGMDVNQVRYFLAIVQMQAGLYEQAIVNLQHLQDQTNSNYIITWLLSNAQMKAGNLFEAKKTINSFMLKFPHLSVLQANDVDKMLINSELDAVSFMFLEISRAVANRVEAANICMQIAYYLHPSSVVVTREMAGFYEYFGDDARAINYYKLIPPTASMYNLAKTRIAFSNYKLGHKQEAKASLLKIIKEKHLNAARIILAEIYVQEFAYLKAASMYKAIADSSYSADAIVYELIGDCYSLAKDYVSAEEYWNQALSLKPNQAIILNKLGYVSLLANGDVMRASALVKRALELDPNDAAIIDSYGFALYMQGRYQESLVYLERAAKILPSSYEVIEHLGNSYFKLGRVSEAERYWQIALDIFVMQVQQKIVQDDVEYIQKLEEQIKEGI